MIQRGTVERVDGSALYVSIPAYGDAVIGPMEVTYDPKTGLPHYNVGDRVLIGQIGNIKEEMVVIGRSVDGIDPDTLPADPDTRTPSAVIDVVATPTVYFDSAGQELGTVLISWGHRLTALDGTPQEIDHFEVRRKVSTANDTAFELVGMVSGTELSATLTGIRTRKADKTAESYVFDVRAVGANALPSAWVRTSTVNMVLDTTAPGTPTGITALNDATILVFRWDGSLAGDTPPTDFSHIVVQTAKAITGPWSPTGTLYSAGELNLAGLAVGTTAWFRAQSVDKTGNVSGWTVATSATTKAAYDDTAIRTALEEAEAALTAAQAEADRQFAELGRITTQAQADLDAATKRLAAAESVLAPLAEDVATAQQSAQDAAKAALAAEARAAEANNRAMTRLANGNFEDGLNYWKSSTGLTLVGTAHSGTQAAQVDGSARLTPTTMIPVIPGQIWEVQAYVRPATTGVLAVGLMDAEGTEHGVKLVTAVPGQWTTTGPVRVTIPAGVDQIAPMLYRSSGGALIVDDIALRDVTDVVRLEQAANAARELAEEAASTASALALRVDGVDSRLDAAEQSVADARAEASTALSDLDTALTEAFQTGLGDVRDTAEAAEAAAIEAKEKAVAAALLRIDSSKGSVFKNNSISTVLSATIYYAGKTITDIAGLHEAFGTGSYLEWSWRREDDTDFGLISSADNRLSRAGFSLTVSPADVDEKTVFQCNLHA